MKKFALAALTAVVATVSLSNVAEARRRHFDDDFDGWDRPHHRHHDFDVVVFRRPDCSTTKIIKQTEWGTKVIVVKRCD
jgi:hypothetical protein